MKVRRCYLAIIGIIVTFTNVNGQVPEPLSLHVLDYSNGGNAANVACKLYKQNSDDGSFEIITTQATDENGRADLLAENLFTTGIYRLWLDTKSYFESKGMDTFWPVWEATFNVTNPSVDYHIPVGLSAYSFNTYRGS